MEADNLRMAEQIKLLQEHVSPLQLLPAVIDREHEEEPHQGERSEYVLSDEN